MESADPSALPEGEAQGKREALTALPACQLGPVRAPPHLWPARACSHGSVHRPPPRACSHGSVHRPCPRMLVLRCMSTYAASSFSFVAYRPCPPTMMLLPWVVARPSIRHVPATKAYCSGTSIHPPCSGNQGLLAPSNHRHMLRAPPIRAPLIQLCFSRVRRCQTAPALPTKWQPAGPESCWGSAVSHAKPSVALAIGRFRPCRRPPK